MRPNYRGKEWKDHGGIDPEPGKQERKGLDNISSITDTDHDGVIADRKSYSAIAEDRLPYVQIDRVGDFTAGAGCVIYDGGTWPTEYNGDYFTTEPTINNSRSSMIGVENF